ncbi:integrase [Streptomyces sp. ISL-99]|nr:integrase [Streptomyces sp. ISL-99]
MNDPGRDLTRFLLPEAGRLVETDEPQEPYRLLDPAGLPVVPVAAFFAELQAASRSVTAVRSYGMDLLRWYRFLWAVDVAWNRAATRSDARDFSRWLQLTDKPVRVRWRHQRQGVTVPRPRRSEAD